MTEVPHEFYVNEDGQCEWGCYDCKHKWLADKKYHFSYCHGKGCGSGDTGVKMKDGTWYRFKLFEWEIDGRSPWELEEKK